MEIKKNKLTEADEVEVTPEDEDVALDLPTDDETDTEVDTEVDADVATAPDEDAVQEDNVASNLLLTYLQQKTQEAADIDTFIANVTDDKIRDVLNGLKADTLRHIGALQAVVAHSSPDGAEIDAARAETAETLGDETATPEDGGEDDGEHTVDVIEPIEDGVDPDDPDGGVDMNDLSNITITKNGEDGEETEETDETDEFAIDGEDDTDDNDEEDEEDDGEKKESINKKTESLLNEEKLSLAKLTALRDDNNGNGEAFQKYVQKVCATIGKDLDGNKFKFYGKGKGVVVDEMFEDALGGVKTGAGQELLDKGIAEYINKEYPFLQFAKTDVQKISTVKLINVRVYLAIKGQGEDMKQNEALAVLDTIKDDGTSATIDDIKDSLGEYYGATDVKLNGNTITGNITPDGRKTLVAKLTKGYGFTNNGNGEYTSDNFNGCKATVTFNGDGFTFVMDCKKNEALYVLDTLKNSDTKEEPVTPDTIKWDLIQLYHGKDVKVSGNTITGTLDDGHSRELFHRIVKGYKFTDNGNGEYTNDNFGGCFATVRFDGNNVTITLDPKKDESLDEDLVIQSELCDYEPWSGAVDNWNYITSQCDLATIDSALEELFPDGCTMTELNDFIWFEPETLYSYLGIPDPYAEPEEEEEEDDDIEDVDDIEDADEGLCNGKRCKEDKPFARKLGNGVRKTESLEREPKKELTLEERIALEDEENEKMWARFSKNAENR